MAWDGEPTEIQLLLLAAFAYFDTRNDWDVFGFLAPPKCAFFNSDPYQGFGLVHGRHLVLGFRGTELMAPRAGGIFEFFQDWATNLNILPMADYKGGKVHPGFRAGVSALWPQVSPFVAENPVDRIFVVGHSQGAALAVLATAKLMKQTPTPLTMCVFAPPMVGDQAFVNWMDGQARSRAGTHLIRYTNSLDPVPLVPPITELTPYYPGPGMHVHLRSRDSSDISHREVYDGGMDAFYSENLPKPFLFPLWLAHRALDARFHFPAGPKLLHKQHDSRPGYLPCLRRTTPPVK